MEVAVVAMEVAEAAMEAAEVVMEVRFALSFSTDCIFYCDY